jgi:hypothetical protein
LTQRQEFFPNILAASAFVLSIKSWITDREETAEEMAERIAITTKTAREFLAIYNAIIESYKNRWSDDLYKDGARLNKILLKTEKLVELEAAPDSEGKNSKLDDILDDILLDNADDILGEERPGACVIL